MTAGFFICPGVTLFLITINIALAQKREHQLLVATWSFRIAASVNWYIHNLNHRDYYSELSVMIFVDAYIQRTTHQFKKSIPLEKTEN